MLGFTSFLVSTRDEGYTFATLYGTRKIRAGAVESTSG